MPDRGRGVVSAAAAACLVALWSGPSGAAPGAPVPSRWCGTLAAALHDRPDAVAGNQVHVIYAIPADGPNRFATRVRAIAADLARIDGWWRAQDPSRAPRFDLFAGACNSTFGRADVSFVRLSLPSSELPRLQGRQAPRVNNELRDLGFSIATKKYLVFYDGPIEAGSHSCGTSQGGTPLKGGTFSIVPLRDNKACGTIGTGGLAAVVAVHELLHNLGAVPKGAPHRCADSGHICGGSDGDIMLSGGKNTAKTLADAKLDPGRGDYYGHNGSWWDVQDSPWLIRVA